MIRAFRARMHRDACRSRIGIAFAALACCCSLPAVADAQCNKQRTHRAVEDLFLSEIVYPQERGETQLEIKPGLERGAEDRTESIGLNIEYGLTNAWQLETEWESVGNVSVGSKYAFRCIHASPYHLTIGADLQLPTGTLNQDSADKPAFLDSAFLAGRDLASGAHVFSGLVISIPVTRREEPGTRWTFMSDTGAFVRIVTGFRATGELAVTGGPDIRPSVQFAPGGLWHWRDRMEVGISGLVGINRGATHGMLTHAVYEFGGQHNPKK